MNKQIFRITHIDNLPFILEKGLRSSHSSIQDPNFKPIGFPSLIGYRDNREVPIKPKGTLGDYIPFYFWYRSPMLYVIYKGNDSEVIQTNQEDIIYLVSDFDILQKNKCQFLFTDRHAKLNYAEFYDNPEDIEKLNWDYIKTPKWGRQYGAERREIKQAECLVYRYMPKEAIIGIAVKSEKSQTQVEEWIKKYNIKIPVKIKSKFYF